MIMTPNLITKCPICNNSKIREFSCWYTYCPLNSLDHIAIFTDRPRIILSLNESASLPYIYIEANEITLINGGVKTLLEERDLACTSINDDKVEELLNLLKAIEIFQ